MKLIPLSEVATTAVEWVWPGFLPAGALVMLDGDPGTGKSTLARDLIARVTSGSPWPDGAPAAAPAHAILLQAEDSPATVRAGLSAAGADLDRVFVVSPGSGQFLLPDNIPSLAEAAQHRPRLIVVDPLSSFVSGGMSCGEGAIRQALTPLVGLAEQIGAAVVVLRHLRKNASGPAIYRGLGSVGAIALARVGLAVIDDPGCDERHRHVLLPTKSNLATAASALDFRTVLAGDTIGIEWLGRSAKRPDELIREDIERSARDEARRVLCSVLEHGAVAAKEVYKAAGATGISRRTLQRAKRDLGVRSRKHGSGRDSTWFWEINPQSPVVAAIQAEAHDNLCDELFHGAAPLDLDVPQEPGFRGGKGTDDSATAAAD
jgi:hypothetical protein